MGNYKPPYTITNKILKSVILNKYNSTFGFIPIESVIRDNQEKYYQSLEKSGISGESTPFVEFMLEIISKTLKKLKKENVPKNIPLNRHNDIIKLIKNNKDITILQIADKLNVTDKTIKRDMLKLKNENKIKRVGSLKSGHWEILKGNT